MSMSSNAAVMDAAGAAELRNPETIHTLIIGIGNSLLTDDGAGVHVIEQLKQADLPDSVELVDGGTLGFALLEMVESAQRLIVVDAAQLDAEPGTVKSFRNQDMDVYLTSRKRSSVHEVNLLDIMAAAKFRGLMPREYALVGIQPSCMDWGSEPTEPVARGVAEATRLVLAMIDEEVPA
ncbi:MAG: HyaD/HybD family hydrogenase maturation endopeptidase [Wenzhouxiangella sp.]